jgi:flagellar motor protein MotB
MVLGLTMAETLLLLVFCLLIAAASVFSYQANQLKEAQREAETLRDDLREAQNTIDVMEKQMPGGVISDNWEHLVRDYPNVDRLTKAGVSLKDAADAADVVVAAVQAKKDGATAEDVTRSLTLQKAIRRELSASPGGVPTNEQIISIIREGRAALTASSETGGKGKHNWPPIITLSEADGLFFTTGSAVLSDKFRSAISGPVMEQLLHIISDYPDVNIIEVIGYTDDQPLMPRNSNLDDLLIPVLAGRSSVMKLIPGDNAGLGLSRAVSVAQVLLNDKRLSRFAVLPYSGAQLVNVNDSLVLTSTGADVKERRRIEIRLRKSDRAGLRIPTPTPTVLSVKKTSVPLLPASGLDTTTGQTLNTLPQPQPPQPSAKNNSESKGILRRLFFRN